MKIAKTIVGLSIVGALSLCAVETNEVSSLVDKINQTSDVKTKSKLMQKLKDKLSVMKEDEYTKAKEIVNKSLVITRTPVKKATK